jgi:hypothetical protein
MSPNYASSLKNMFKSPKRSRGRPRTRALRSPNLCAPGVMRKACQPPNCTWVHSSDIERQPNYCRRKTNKRRRA